MLEKIKKCYFSIFIGFTILSVMYTIAQVINDVFDIDGGAFIAFWIVAISAAKIQDNFKKIYEEEVSMIKDVYSLNYCGLTSIEKISISYNGQGIVLLKNNSIRTIDPKTIPRTQEELELLDKQFENV